MSARDVDVLIAGAGPTGLIAANLLGRLGVTTLVVETNTTTSDVPKAILIDDEALRTCQAADLGEAVSEIVLLGYGARYYSARGKCFATVSPRVSPYGYPRRNSFAQPELEQVLLQGLERYDHVGVRFSTTLTSFEHRDGALFAALRGAGGKQHTVRASYLLGCDGGRSTVRKQLGIEMRGSTFAQPWIVIDTVNDPDDGRYTRFFCDPRRPTVSVPGRAGRRYSAQNRVHVSRAAGGPFSGTAHVAAGGRGPHDAAVCWAGHERRIPRCAHAGMESRRGRAGAGR